MKNTKVFISNAEIIDKPFLDFCDSNGIDLFAKSLITFKPVVHNPVFDADVVFFSSPRSVEFFVESIQGKNLQCACLGSGTAKRLAEFGYSADFVGSVSGQPDVVSKEFLIWLGNRKVIFPLSTKSNRSISATIPAGQRIEVVVYETISLSEKLDLCEIYVFTSPSNIDAFLEKNVLPGTAEVVAWGKTTEKRLLELKILPSFVLRDSSLRDLEEALSK